MKYEMKLKNEPFNLIKTNKKILELRLYDEKRRLLNVNDYIEFTNLLNNEKLLVQIESLHIFRSFVDLYNFFDKTLMGYELNEKAEPSDMEEYYSKEEQEKNGVIAIKIRKM